jgi:large subunit ribosomal protein L24
MAAKIRKGDRVVVLAGKDKGKVGEVLSVLPKENRATVAGVNTQQRHTKQSGASEGGIIAKAGPIHLSNLALVGADGKPTRVGFKFQADGTKVRFAKRSGEVIDV